MVRKDIVEIKIQRITPSNKGLNPTFCNVFLLSPAPIKNKVTTKQRFAANTI